MPSTDVAALIEQQLEKTSGELALLIDDMPVSLQRRPGGWFYLVELTLGVEISLQVIELALRLTAPALVHFTANAAALCFNPQNETLNLIVRLKNDQTDYALSLLESICNQCEVWQETLLSVLTQQRVKMSV
ncbi:MULTISPECIES: hypothetical protein [Erwinia]|uniref:hypothetical protein n=1 Tax=Erwinia TaxID=551 RepID=UPI0005531EE5|nr:MULTISPECIES: hypothetical protein [Erwinia]